MGTIYRREQERRKELNTLKKMVQDRNWMNGQMPKGRRRRNKIFAWMGLEPQISWIQCILPLHHANHVPDQVKMYVNTQQWWHQMTVLSKSHQGTGKREEWRGWRLHYNYVSNFLRLDGKTRKDRIKLSGFSGGSVTIHSSG